MANDNLKECINRLCNSKIIEGKIRSELNEALKLMDEWEISPPREVHAELLVIDALTEPRPLGKQVKRLNIALSFLIHILSENIARNNKEFIKLFLGQI